jgi:hypothetical protein
MTPHLFVFAAGSLEALSHRGLLLFVPVICPGCALPKAITSLIRGSSSAQEMQLQVLRQIRFVEEFALGT